MNEEERTFRELAEGAAAEYEASSPKQQDLFRREFVFANIAGFLSAGVVEEGQDDRVCQAKIDARVKIRDRVREHIAEHPQDTALSHLIASQVILVEEYEAAAKVDARLQPEYEMTTSVAKWPTSHPEIVDDAFAERVFAYIKL